jgi:hypothetical protein
MASSGWAQLGSALAGNPARQAVLYDQGATGVARLEGLLSEARRRRDEEAGYAGITPEAISAAQSDQSQAPALIAAMFHAGVNPTQLSGYNREALGTTIQQDAYNRARGGASVADLNPLLAAFNGKPVEVSKVQGDVAFNPYATPDQNTFDPTQIGLAEIMQKGAQADASRAAATNSYAHAAKARSDIGSGAAPSPGGGGFGRPPSGYRFDADGNLQAIPGGPADKRPTGGGQRAPNNEQSNAAGFANRMVAAGKELAALEESGYDPTSVVDRSASAIGGVIGNTLISGKGQRYNQAAQNWVRANLRKESGAAIGKDEMEKEIGNYFPVAGDTPETIAQKAANRQIVEQNMIRTAGPAWRGTGEAASPSPASNVSPGGAGGNQHRVGDVITVGGKQYRVVGGDPSDPEVEPL